MDYNICELVRKMENDYTSGSTQTSKYVEFDQYENINKIEAYLNSRHISGAEDSLGREKPFFNIVTAAVNIWDRATDIDRKDIRIKATKQEHYVPAFLATILLNQWMKKNNFGKLLNLWGRSLARYGSSVLKFVEKGTDLHAQLIPWNRLICDPIDFNANPKIEKLFLTPGQLRANKSYDQKIVDQLLETRQAREDLHGETKDNRSEYIELYEIHGEIELSYLTGQEKDEDKFVQQMHVVSFVGTKEKGKYDDFSLVSGKEAKDPYVITHLMEEEGRTQSIGAVEHLFEAQWMVNHTAKQIKDQLDLASNLIFQTSDGNYVGRNVLTDIVTGDILIHEANQPLTQINNQSHDITSLQNFSQQWQVQAKEISGTPDVMQGKALPSGTAYRQAAILQSESHSLFEKMIENKALQLEDILRQYVIPNLEKQMDSTEEISSLLDSQSVSQFDALYIPAEAVTRSNRMIIDASLKGEVIAQPDINLLKQQVREDLGKYGNQRFLKPSEIDGKTWQDLLKDFAWEVEIPITNEFTDKDTVMTTLTTVLQTIAANPMVLQDPNMKVLFNKILEETGAISPVEIVAQPQPSLMSPTQPGQSGQLPIQVNPQPQLTTNN